MVVSLISLGYWQTAILLQHPLLPTTTPATALLLMSSTSSPQQQQQQGGIAARLARQNILDLLPYRCARDDYSVGILLDANENAFGPPILGGGGGSQTNGGGGTHASAPPDQTTEEEDGGEVFAAAPAAALERYPDPYQIPLKLKYAAYRGHNLDPSNLFVGVGSDEAIDLLMRIFCVPGRDKILTTPPTYGMYKVCAKVNDVDIVSVPLSPQFDVQIQPVSTW
jgi:histidinol-phosphate aminotransferase